MLTRRRKPYARGSAYRRDRGGPFINTTDELGGLALQDRPVWVMADRNVEWAVGPNTRDFLARGYQEATG